MAGNELMARLVLACERIAAALEARNKKKSSTISRDPLVMGFLAGISSEVQETWLQVYGPDRIWVEAQVKEAAAWWTANPDRRKPGDTVARFVNGWLSRAKKKLNEPPPMAPVDVQPKTKPKLPTGVAFEFDETGKVLISPRDKVIAPWEK